VDQIANQGRQPDNPKQRGFHALRHFLATTLITNHVDPKDVQ
jgi:hypothetical protein